MGNAALKRSTYSGMLFRVSSMRVRVLFISPGFSGGPLAWATKSAARPSQN